jgi:prophage regulatory protein
MTEQTNASPLLALLRRPEVTRRTGLSRSTLYARMKVGTFPKPVYLTPTTPAWIEAEIDGWIATLIIERDARLSLAA